ncbi:VOC family protein [Streptomyces prasinus]
MTNDASRIRLVQTVLDSTNVRELAEFYRSLLGLDYAERDEPPPVDQPDEHDGDWLVLREPDWPDGPVPQQVHLDLSITSLEDCGTSTSACSPSATACSAIGTSRTPKTTSSASSSRSETSSPREHRK